MNCKKNLLIHFSLLTLVLTLTACGGGSSSSGGDSQATQEIKVDGSSTVFPISEAMAEEFENANEGVNVIIGVSGSGGGFKKFCAGETDISNASRPIKESEIKLCAEQGIEYVEVPVAFDGVSVVVNKNNNWAKCLKAEDLGKMWTLENEGKINNWNQVRSEFPSKELRLYGPGTDSGTFDYFVEATIPNKGESRGDYTASEDDNVIVQGVTTDEGGLGYFGYAYYEENKDKLKLVPIENADGKCVEPSEEAIADGTYNPLSRPIFFYVKTSSLENPAIKAFVDYQVDPANGELISEVGYVPLPAEIQAKVKERVDDGTTGSIFDGGSSVGVKLTDKL